MNHPNINCQVTASINLLPSESPDKLKDAISNVLHFVNFENSDDTITASSKKIESLTRIYETIHSRNAQKNYRRQLLVNSDENSTWLYLNKQAAFVNVVALCNEPTESPLGPIKIIIKSSKIQEIIEWLTNE